MLLTVTSAQTLGLLIRATRRSQKVRIDDVAGSVGVGPVFVREVERGKETVQLGRVMKLLAELGIELKADVPEEVFPEITRLRLVGMKPLKPRQRPSKSETAAAAPAADTGTDKSAIPPVKQADLDGADASSTHDNGDTR